MLMAELKVVGGKHDGKIIPLQRNRFLIGRGDDCQLRPASGQVSRHHCAFTLDDYTVRLRDLGSTNGTLVNENRIRGEVILKTGDRVKVGTLDFEVLISEQASGADIPAPAEMPVVLQPDTPPEMTELSTTDTVFEIPATPKSSATVNGGNAAAAGETVALPQPPVPSQPVGNPQQQVPANQAPAPYPQQQPVQYPQQQPVQYPQQQPVQYPQQQPVQYPQQQPVQYPQQQPVQYPQQQPFLYPQQSLPAYPQQPVAYPQPGMPYQQPETPPGQDTAVVPELPIRLPSPETTGATAPPTPVKVAQNGENSDNSSAGQDPSSFAADVLKNFRQRLPDS